MRIAVCILAKNEAQTITLLLAQLSRQSLFRLQGVAIDVYVVANGCTDDTAARASSAEALLESTKARLRVYDLPQGGKSRAWNKAVHDLIEPGADFFLFLDSDITLAHGNVLEEVVATLESATLAFACSGHPVKDIETKPRKNALEQFSLAISRRSRANGAINGSLYLARSAALQDVWLPDQTPGEDGFLNAMLTTLGFTQAPVPERVISMTKPTHYYRAHRSVEFVAHERRMIVGTMVNRWIFEHLWSLQLAEPAGRLLRDWNEQRPDWVDRLVAKKTRDKAWVIPNAILFGRLHRSGQAAWWKLPLQLAAGAVATILTIPPAVAANRRLKQLGAADTW